MPVVPHALRAALRLLLGGVLLVSLGGCLIDNSGPATPVAGSPTPGPALSATAVATIGETPGTPDLPTAVPITPPPGGADTPAPVAQDTPTADDAEATPPPETTDTPTPARSAPPATATRTPRATLTPTLTPTTIPTTVPIARFKPAARLIAFERHDQIWTVSTDGKTVKQLTQNGHNYHPVWSPDGKTLAFFSNRDNPRYRLYFMDADGGNARPVSGPILAPTSGGDTPGVFGLDYAFSPDGKRLVYMVQLEPYVSSQFMLLDIAGGDVRPLTAPPGTTPVPAPTAPTPPTPTAAEALESATPGAGTPRPAPPTPTITPTVPPPAPVEAVGQPAWALDNHTLAYVDSSNLDQDVIYLLDVDSGQRTALTKENAVNRSPVFSRDGKTVFYTSSAEASMIGLNSELYSVARTGKNRVKLTPGFSAQPGWGSLHLAPDGTTLAIDWSARQGGFGDPWNNEVTLVTTAGKAPVDLSGAYPRPNYGADSPSWAPDSRYLTFDLYYCANADCTKGTNQIVVADTDAKKVTLAVLTDGFAPAWQP